MFEVPEENHQALICSCCFKELFQCILFRKKCQSADEYFKTKSEEHLWNNGDLQSVKHDATDQNFDSGAIEYCPSELQTEEFLSSQFSEASEEKFIDDSHLEEKLKLPAVIKAKQLRKNPLQRKNS